MPLSAIAKIRSLIGDNDKISVAESVIENADGSTRLYQLDMVNIRTGTESFFISGRAITSATVSHLVGTVEFTSGSNLSGTTAPTAAAQIVATYQYNALNDDEIQFYIDQASGNGDLIAGALAARALAANFSRYFSYSQGDKSIDKRFIARNLLDIAESLEKAHENAIAKGGMTMTVGSFDDSGTAFDNYDTAASVLITAES